MRGLTYIRPDKDYTKRDSDCITIKGVIFNVHCKLSGQFGYSRSSAATITEDKRCKKSVISKTCGIFIGFTFALKSTKDMYDSMLHAHFNLVPATDYTDNNIPVVVWYVTTGTKSIQIIGYL